MHEVFYRTVVASNYAADMQATPNLDFTSQVGLVEIGDNETSAAVEITIKQVNSLSDVAGQFLTICFPLGRTTYLRLENISMSI